MTKTDNRTTGHNSNESWETVDFSSNLRNLSEPQNTLESTDIGGKLRTLATGLAIGTLSLTGEIESALAAPKYVEIVKEGLPQNNLHKQKADEVTTVVIGLAAESAAEGRSLRDARNEIAIRESVVGMKTAGKGIGRGVGNAMEQGANFVGSVVDGLVVQPVKGAAHATRYIAESLAPEADGDAFALKHEKRAVDNAIERADLPTVKERSLNRAPSEESGIND